MSRLNFTLDKEASGSKARAATYQTLHGEVQTPIFMPVGTQATVKSQTVETLKATGANIVLANTYHLLLRPGPEVFKKFGGIHNFMKWDRPVLTDSGGFQIFSLQSERAMEEEGAHFKSYVDGKTLLLSPESSIAMQKAIGSDIMMVLDQCIPSTAGHPQAEAAMLLTHRWAERSLRARGDSKQALFGIVQGACHHDLRQKSAEFLRTLGFDGLAIGGLAVGETHAERYEFTGFVTDHLPKDVPRYLMGVGTPIDLLEAVHRGVDMFDCIIPTQLAQRGAVFTSQGKLQLTRSVHKFSEQPIDAHCDCHACQNYSRGYLHHLTKTSENLGWHLLGIHNLAFYHRLMRAMRAHILRDDFAAFYTKMRVELVRTDEANPSQPTKQTRFPRPQSLGDYDIVTGPQGFSSIRQLSSGEVMHSVNRPSDEAQKLYVDQSCLASRLLARSATVSPAGSPEYPARTGRELVLWDVGLGAASNAMAAIECFEKMLAEHGPAALRPLRIVSFERDLDPLRLALREPGKFPHIRHAAPHALVSHRRWHDASGLLHWELHHGDFLAFLETSPVPEIIFYDPFSSKTDSPLWTPAVFARLFTHCAPKSAELYTYSAATSVRVTLLSTGWIVAEGAGSGPKSTTTAAFNRAESASAHPSALPLLGAEWLARWHRSSSKFPAGLPESERAAFEHRIAALPQFSTQPD